jgi:hypothetical protein
MTPVDLIPAADAIPVHWGWFKVLLILTFTIHILLMNAMLGSGIIAFASRLTSDRTTRDLQKDVSGKLTILMAFTINFGVAPLLFLQALYGHFFYTSSQLMAVFWLSVIGVLIIGYYSAYLYKYRFDGMESGRNWFLGTAMVVLLFVAFIFVNNMTLMITPISWPRYFDNPQGTLLNLTDPTLIPRYLHFITASVAMGGLFIALVWEVRRRRGSVAEAPHHIRRGLNWFLYATFFQLIFGFWFQMRLPREIMALFMGASPFHTGIFLLALGMMVLALISGVRGRVGLTTAAALVLVFLMVIMRDLVRTAYLAPYFTLDDLTVTGQYSSLIAFLIALTAGAAAVALAARWGLSATSAPNR